MLSWILQMCFYSVSYLSVLVSLIKCSSLRPCHNLSNSTAENRHTFEKHAFWRFQKHTWREGREEWGAGGSCQHYLRPISLLFVKSSVGLYSQKGQAGIFCVFPAFMARLSLTEAGLLLLFALALVSIHPEATHTFHLDSIGHAGGMRELAFTGERSILIVD